MRYQLGPNIEIEESNDPTWARVGSAVALEFAQRRSRYKALSVVRARAADDTPIPFMAEARWDLGRQRYVVLRAAIVPPDAGLAGVDAWSRRLVQAGGPSVDPSQAEPSPSVFASVLRYFGVLDEPVLRQLEGLPCGALRSSLDDVVAPDGTRVLSLLRIEDSPTEGSTPVAPPGFSVVPVPRRRAIELRIASDGGVHIVGNALP